MSTHGQSWPGGGARRWPVILAWVLALAAVAAFLVVLLGGNSTTVVRTVIVPMPTASAPLTQDTAAGALTDAEQFWAASDDLPGSGSYTVAYRLDSYASTTATLEGWGVVTGNGDAKWQTTRVTVHYSNGRWQPVGVREFETVVEPIANPLLAPQFNARVASFHRFPGAP